MPETSYAPCGDLSLAYQVFGDGPIELVFVGPFISHVELFWTVPEFKAFFDQLATFCRIVVFDKAGVGLSDPVPHVRTLDDRAAEIEAVMDAVGFGRAVLFGFNDGGLAVHCFRGNTTGANAGVDPRRLVFVPRRHGGLGRRRARPGRAVGALRSRAGRRLCAVGGADHPDAGNRPRCPLGVGQRCDVKHHRAVSGRSITLARHV